jgi:hypothetical protein
MPAGYRDAGAWPELDSIVRRVGRGLRPARADVRDLRGKARCPDGPGVRHRLARVHAAGGGYQAAPGCERPYRARSDLRRATPAGSGSRRLRVSVAWTARLYSLRIRAEEQRIGRQAWEQVASSSLFTVLGGASSSTVDERPPSRTYSSSIVATPSERALRDEHVGCWTTSHVATVSATIWPLPRKLSCTRPIGAASKSWSSFSVTSRSTGSGREPALDDFGRDAGLAEHGARSGARGGGR